MKWEYRSLQNIIEKPISGEWGDGEGETNVIRTTNFTNDGSLDLSDVVQRNIPLKKIEQKKLEFGDTIIEKSGGSPNQPVGRVVYFDQKDTTFLCNNFTSVIRAKSEVDKRYLFWFLFSNHLNQNTLRYQNKTTGIINLQLDRYITDLQIPLPPLATQKRIAAILDAADALRRKDQALLQKYDELAQAIFMDMFGDPVKNEKGWEEKKLGEICSKITDGEHLNPKFIESGEPLIMAKDILFSGVDFSDPKFVSFEDFVKFTKKCNPEYGDLILVSRGATIGRCCVVNTPKSFCMMGSTILIKPGEKILSEYLFQLFRVQNFKNRLVNVSSASAQQAIYIKNVKDLQTPVPPIEFQIEFFKKITLKNQQQLMIQKSLNQSETLFQSLLQKAFNAELVP